jgi:eukaryotic-like serine/threonine-protein kinase
MSTPAPRRHFYDDLSPAAQRLARVPRLARLLGQLPPQRAAALGKTAAEADVFWAVYTHDTTDGRGDCGLLADGLKVESARRMAWREDSDPSPDFRDHQIKRACALLGAIAFELFARQDSAGRPLPWLNGVSDNLTGFRYEVLKRFIGAGALLDCVGNPENPAHFFSDWTALLAMDSHGLKHFLFSTDARDQQLRWTDVTTMAFFAAYWACRWATPQEQKQTRAWIIGPLENTNAAYYEFWKFASEMAEDAVREEPQRWIDFMAPLYVGDVAASKSPPLRSSEFIYRSWGRMQRWDAEPLRQFLAEFGEVRKGNQGAEKQAIAEKMLAGFTDVVASGKPGDTVEFTMGAPDGEYPDFDGRGDRQRNPQHRVKLSPFRLHRFCVTNVEYELFDPRHETHRWEKANEHPLVKQSGDSTADDDCPVVRVSWYDAWCFARWTGNHLPTEAQWEYACRGGASSYQTFHFGDSLSSTQANFDGKYPHGNGVKGPSLGCTSKVGSYRQPNAFGLHDMHGNVYEWCEDWYTAGFYRSEEARGPDPVNRTMASARVLRGGCWFYDGGRCRSALRSWDEPVYRFQDYGFRLAAVPCIVGAEPGKGGGGAEATKPSGVELE